MAHLVCHERYYNPTRAPWHAILRVAGSPALGVVAEYRSALTSSVGHWLYSLRLGAARPAYHLPFVPTSHNGAFQSGDTSALYGGVRWVRLIDSQAATWTIPDEPIGNGGWAHFDRLAVFYRQAASNGTLKVDIAFNGVDWVAQGTINTSGALNYDAIATLTISGGTLAPYSKIRLSVDGGEGTVDPQCLVLWDADGVCLYSSEQRFVPDSTPLREDGEPVFDIIHKANNPVSHWRHYGGWKYYATSDTNYGTLHATSQQVLRVSGQWTPPGAGYATHAAYFTDALHISTTGSTYDEDADELLIETTEKHVLLDSGIEPNLDWSILCPGTTIQTVKFGRLLLTEVPEWLS